MYRPIPLLSTVKTRHGHFRLESGITAIGSLVVLGPSIGAFARDRAVALEAVAELSMNVWGPAACPLCASGVPLETVGAQGTGNYPPVRDAGGTIPFRR